MAVRLFAGLHWTQDDGSVLTDGEIEFFLAGTSTPYTVYTDKDLSAGATDTVELSATGYAPDIWAADNVALKARITGTGFTTDTIDYLTVATSTEAGETATELAFKNALVNGGFASWTGGTSFSNISGDGDGDEIADGWYFTQPAAASNAVSRQTGEGDQTRYALRFGRPSSSTSTNELRVWQMLKTEEVYRLRGAEVTVSFSVRSGADFSGTGLAIRLATGTSEGEDGDLIDSGGLAGHSSVIDTSQAITTTLTRYEFSATLAENIKEVGLQFSYTGVGTAGSNDWAQIEDVQIEIADAATEFAALPEQVEWLRANQGVIPRTDAAQTWSEPQTFQDPPVFSAGLPYATQFNNTGDPNEGGALVLEAPDSGTTLDGAVKVDWYEDRIRIFETGGSLRGIYIDMADAPADADGRLVTQEMLLIGGEFRNLKIDVTSATQAVITADALTVESSTGYSRRLLSVSETCALTTSGAGGLDTGSEANSTWYYVFVIYNPTTADVSSLFSTSATAPTLPSGYTHYRRVGAVYNDGSGNLWRTLQYGRRATIRVGTNPTALIALASSTSGNVSTPTWTAVAVSAAVPPTACAIDLVFGADSNQSQAMAAPNNSYGAYNSTTNPPPLMFNGENSSTQGQNVQAMMMLEGANIYYASSATAALLKCAGWEDNL